jgi:hypothetical protein
MNKRLLGMATVLAVSLGTGAVRDAAQAQTVSPSVASEAVGKWLYDAQGNTIGSVRSVDGDGRSATIMVGSYFRPGSYETRVPARAISTENGRVTLRNDVIQALNAGTRPQG